MKTKFKRTISYFSIFAILFCLINFIFAVIHEHYITALFLFSFISVTLINDYLQQIIKTLNEFKDSYKDTIEKKDEYIKDLEYKLGVTEQKLKISDEYIENIKNEKKELEDKLEAIIHIHSYKN